uniref:Translation initiation factor IF-3 n=1 Tax=Mycoplasma feriruminatoris TaxID=1179777 RepID=A0A654IAS4_9MOLU|nr:Translation initiation factor IF-3 [Mycoplasma feriruminatoris]
MENRNRNSRPIKNQDPINEFIRAHQVLVIDEDKQNLGVMSKRQALEIAKSKNLDLYQVGVQPDGTVITRIVNYGKLKYEQQKNLKKLKNTKQKLKIKKLELQ